MPDGMGYALHILGRCYLLAGTGRGRTGVPAAGAGQPPGRGQRRRQAATLRSIGTAQSRVGLMAEARDSWTRAAAIFEELGDSAEAAEIRAELAASGIS